ncbi:hypothetical protein BASA81_005932 [Batrachochytrium salamandrivorans]|nr:hypothetical protein BASA81_005932 [Batrachochytrium salamandrivorans]
MAWPRVFLWTSLPCEQSGNCGCEPGWTGAGDFLNADGVMCQIHLAATQAMWGAFLGLSLGLLLLALPKLYGLAMAHIKHGRMRLWDNPGLLGSVLVYLGCVPGFLLVGIGKLAFRERIGGGESVLVNVGWMLSMIGLSFGVSLLRPAILRQALRTHSDSIPNYSHFLRHYQLHSRIASLGVGLGAIWVLPAWISNENVLASRVGIAMLYAQISITLFILAHQNWRIQAILNHTLTQSILRLPIDSTKRHDLQLICNKLVRSHRGFARQTFMGGMLALIGLCAPPFWTVAEYIIPLAWLLPVWGVFKAIDSLYCTRYRVPLSSPFRVGRRSTAMEDKLVEEDLHRLGTTLHVVHDPEDPLFLSMGKEEWKSLAFISNLASSLKRPSSLGSIHTTTTTAAVTETSRV